MVMVGRFVAAGLLAPSASLRRRVWVPAFAGTTSYVYAVRLLVLAPSRADAAVHGEDHTRSIAGAVGGKKRHQVADLPGMRGTAERHALLKFAVAVLVAELVFRARLEQRDVTVGADRPRIDADHADIIGKALAAQRPRERHQRRITGAAADVVSVEFFPGCADVVDDHAVAPRFHLRVNGAGEVDIPEHFQLPGVA